MLMPFFLPVFWAKEGWAFGYTNFIPKTQPEKNFLGDLRDCVQVILFPPQCLAKDNCLIYLGVLWMFFPPVMCWIQTKGEIKRACSINFNGMKNKDKLNISCWYLLIISAGDKQMKDSQTKSWSGSHNVSLRMLTNQIYMMHIWMNLLPNEESSICYNEDKWSRKYRPQLEENPSWIQLLLIGKN